MARRVCLLIGLCLILLASQATAGLVAYWARTTRSKPPNNPPTLKQPFKRHTGRPGAKKNPGKPGRRGSPRLNPRHRQTQP